jgi:hypothetical protein
MKDPLPHLITTPVAIICLSTKILAADTNERERAPTNVAKEVLLREDGKDRHWVIKSNSVIVQEHCLTVHGDLHVMIEYPHGVKAPQVDAPERGTNAASVTTWFWPNGRRMSRTPQVGGLANGDDRVWWPSGQLAREAHFARGKPDGVWKYYDRKGRSLGEGAFALGARQSGVFFGNDNPGGAFFFTNYPMMKSRYDQGQMKEEEIWLKELDAQ